MKVLLDTCVVTELGKAPCSQPVGRLISDPRGAFEILVLQDFVPLHSQKAAVDKPSVASYPIPDLSPATRRAKTSSASRSPGGPGA